MTWESVSVTPVRNPDGSVTVPDAVIQSMQKNKIGLKGEKSGQSHEFSLVTIPRLNLHVHSGPLETQVGKGAISLNLTLRRSKFD